MNGVPDSRSFLTPSIPLNARKNAATYIETDTVSSYRRPGVAGAYRHVHSDQSESNEGEGVTPLGSRSSPKVNGVAIE